MPHCQKGKNEPVITSVTGSSCELAARESRCAVSMGWRSAVPNANGHPHGNPLGLHVRACLEHLYDPRALPSVPNSKHHHWVLPVRGTLTSLRVVRPELTRIKSHFCPIFLRSISAAPGSPATLHFQFGKHVEDLWRMAPSDRGARLGRRDLDNSRGELPLPSEAVNEANRRLVGDCVQFHGWHIGVC